VTGYVSVVWERPVGDGAWPGVAAGPGGGTVSQVLTRASLPFEGGRGLG
jgi:hypothetical protein